MTSIESSHGHGDDHSGSPDEHEHSRDDDNSVDDDNDRSGNDSRVRRMPKSEGVASFEYGAADRSSPGDTTAQGAAANEQQGSEMSGTTPATGDYGSLSAVTGAPEYHLAPRPALDPNYGLVPSERNAFGIGDAPGNYGAAPPAAVVEANDKSIYGFGPPEIRQDDGVRPPTHWERNKVSYLVGGLLSAVAAGGIGAVAWLLGRSETDASASGSTVTSDIRAIGRVGRSVSIEVAVRDRATADPATLRIGGTTADVTSYAAPGEGTWTVDSAGARIGFEPENGFVGNPTPIVYRVADAAGATTWVGRIEIAYVSPTPVVGAAIFGESGVVQIAPEGFDVSTLRLVGPAGASETVTNDDGTWSVSDASVTFVPGEDFTERRSPSTEIGYEIRGEGGAGGVALLQFGTISLSYRDELRIWGAGFFTEAGTVSVPTWPGISSDTLTFGWGATSKRVAGQGTWSYDAAGGVVTFTPVDDYIGQPAPMPFTASPSSGTGTVDGQVVFTYVSRTPSTVLVDGTEASGRPGSETSVDLVAEAGDGSTLDPTTVQIGIGAVWGTSLELGAQGGWSVGSTSGVVDGTVIFTAGSTLTHDPVPLAARIKHKDSDRWKQFVVRLAFPSLPDVTRLEATDVVVPGHPGEPTKPVRVDVLAQLRVGSFTPDPTSIRILGFLTLTPEAQQTAMQAKLDPDGKKLDVPRQGVWEVQADGSIVYTPESTTQGDTIPTPIVFTIDDAMGVPSITNGAVIINEAAFDLEQGVFPKDQQTDAEFWAAMKAKVIDDPTVTIPVAAGVVTTLRYYTRLQLTGAARTTRDAIPTPNIGNVWNDSDDKTALLAAVMTNVDENLKTADGQSIDFTSAANRLLLRSLRLDYLDRLLERRVRQVPVRTDLRFRFESNQDRAYVDVLAPGPDGVRGPIASQNAGSTNRSIYYQVGGGGLNGSFADALKAMSPPQFKPVNGMLRIGYDGVYGAGAHAEDATHPPDPARLTSLLTGLAGADAVNPTHARAMVYSVGPVLGASGITDEAAYQRLYYEAYERIAAYNRGRLDPIVGLRITMLSTGIYASEVTDKVALYTASATHAILGLSHAADAFGIPQGGFDVLVNTESTTAANKETTAFTAAFAALAAGEATNGVFTPDLDALRDQWLAP